MFYEGNKLTNELKGAFTPGCSEKHLPTYIKNLDELKGKGVQIIAVIASNDAHVMAAWGKANGIKGDDILFLSDNKCKFSQSYGWTNDDRLARYAMIIEKGIVTYAAKDNPGEVIVSFPLISLFGHLPSSNSRPVRSHSIGGGISFSGTHWMIPRELATPTERVLLTVTLGRKIGFRC